MANTPIDTLREGRLKAAIWRNTGDKGNFYSVTFSRSYQDDAEKWHDSDSFSGTELLRLSRLAGKAYDRVNALRQSDREAVVTPDDGRRT